MKRVLVVKFLMILCVIPSWSQMNDELKKYYTNIVESNIEIERSYDCLRAITEKTQTDILKACNRNEVKNKKEISLIYSYKELTDSLMNLILNIKKDLCILTQGEEVRSNDYQFLFKTTETNDYLINKGNAKKLENKVRAFFNSSNELVTSEQIKRSINLILNVNPTNGIDWHKLNFEKIPFIMATFKLSLLQLRIREIQWNVLTYRLSQLDI